ncbi:phenylalanine--tRNA ligase subunit alpha [Candidatus Eisenbacteria bacterium]|uniref:Phenylalanine--tRNA ligase alpha subunit n=1 Tax=Eiseniibacteriota bacterium TaxID=2212470 RepID=A0ABV6YKY6_UNCEI
MQRFPREQYLILQGLSQESGEVEIAALAQRLEVDQALIAAGAQILGELGLIELREVPRKQYVLKEAGRAAATEKLPERRVLEALSEAARPLTMQELPPLTGLESRDIGASLRYLNSKGWAKKSGPALELGHAAEAGLAGPGEDEKLITVLAGDETGRAFEDELPESEIDLAEALAQLKGHRDLFEVRAKRRRLVQLTAMGKTSVQAGIGEAREVAQLTPELIVSGEWREVALKSYDVNLGVTPVHPGKLHPMQRVISDTRRVYVEMGFEEIRSPMVESAFWNFDALFQPQDHPAREMQDTFYLGRPERIALPADRALVERVSQTHENGGDTGSLGWQYTWVPERAETSVLRTHTTAATARALAENPNGPRKVFCVGRVFRREAIDYKHLPVFYQIDGIIIDASATFANLLGTLAAFYRKMGFEKFEFRPAFFPYTEPSVEVFIWLEKKQDWFEMGGAGMFRPEVTRPLGCDVPVLAWGLGLERVAMLRYDILDMRSLYMTDLEWLKEVPLCR